MLSVRLSCLFCASMYLVRITPVPCIMLLTATKVVLGLCCRPLAERFRNGDMCRLTEQVIFTDPFYPAPVNKHTSPRLDDLATSLYSDTAAKVAASALKVCHQLPLGPATTVVWRGVKYCCGWLLCTCSHSGDMPTCCSRGEQNKSIPQEVRSSACPALLAAQWNRDVLDRFAQTITFEQKLVD